VRVGGQPGVGYETRVMEQPVYDAIVLGGGPAGYVCAIRLGQLGQKVACVESEEVGGVCLNWGCIPSKALIATAHLLRQARESAADRGIRIGSVELDPVRAQEHKDGIVKKLTAGVRGLLKQNGVRLIEGQGRIAGPKAVDVSTRGGGNERLVATKGVVVATGSSAIEIPGFAFDGERIIGAREAVSLRAVPRRLLVVGGGVIGLELGMVYQGLGSQLTIVELLPSLLAGIDPDCVKVVERTLRKRGAAIFTGAQARSYERLPDGSLSVTVGVGNSSQTIECDVVLVAVGMRPRARGFGLEELGVRLDARGFVSTDERCETNVPGVYAIGDVSGPPMLAHKASKEGEVCAEVIAGHRSAKDFAAVPGVVFTDPEIAGVGLTEDQAQERGLSIRVGRFPFAALGRALSIGETDGLVKVIAEASTGRILGIHMVGPAASDLISEACLALEMVATTEDLALTMHPHPTLGEALMEASAAALGRAIHIVNR
jgi:dihydrolipoamide dehydrogenase